MTNPVLALRERLTDPPAATHTVWSGVWPGIPLTEIVHQSL
jgi:hypothetical protein